MTNADVVTLSEAKGLILLQLARTLPIKKRIFESTSGKNADSIIVSERSKGIAEPSSGKGSGKTEGQILSLLADNAGMTIPDLAKILGITTRALEKQIARLREEGRLCRVGAARGGYWEVKN
jgi:predicted HTH transcriptional regulator